VNSATLTTWVQCMLDGTGALGFAFPPRTGTPDTLPVFPLTSTAALDNDNLSISANTLIALDTVLGTGILSQVCPNGTSIPNGCTDFYGYQLWTACAVSVGNPFVNAKLRVPYPVIPLSCFTSASGLASDPSGFYTPFDDLTEGIAHEHVDGLVDPFVPMGWIDLSCPSGGRRARQPEQSNPHVWYQNQELAAYWSNRDQACVAGNNTLATLTLAAAFRNDGPSTFIPQSLKFQLDGRSGKLLGGNGGNGYTFNIQVVNGTSHGYQFPLLQTPAMQVVPIDDTQPVQGNEVINAKCQSDGNLQDAVSGYASRSAAGQRPASERFLRHRWVAGLDRRFLHRPSRHAMAVLQFNWIGSGIILTNDFTANVNQALTYHAQYVKDITTQISFVRSGLTYNRSNRTYYGTIITNNGADTLSNLLPVALTGLPAGVALVNAAGTFNGTPYVNTGTVSSLPPGASTTIPVQFQFAGGTLNYGIAVYSFH